MQRDKRREMRDWNASTKIYRIIYRRMYQQKYKPREVCTYRPTEVCTYRSINLQKFVPTEVCTYRSLYLQKCVPTEVCTYRSMYLQKYVPTEVCTYRSVYLHSSLEVKRYECTDGAYSDLYTKYKRKKYGLGGHRNSKNMLWNWPCYLVISRPVWPNG